MGIEKDFIQREIQKLVLLLNDLIIKASGLNANNIKNDILVINEALENEFDLSLKKLSQIKSTEFISVIKNLHESHIEKLAELIYTFNIKVKPIKLEENYNKKEIAKKGVVLIDYLNENSKIFSLQRMNMKKSLQQSI